MILRTPKLVTLLCTFFFLSFVTALEQSTGSSYKYPDATAARRRRRTVSSSSSSLQVSSDPAGTSSSSSGGLHVSSDPAGRSAPAKNATLADRGSLLETNAPPPKAPPLASSLVFSGLILAGVIQVLRKLDKPLRRFEASYDAEGHEVEDSSEALAVMKDSEHSVVTKLYAQLAGRVGLSCLIGAAPLFIPQLFSWFKHMKYSYAMLGAGVIWTYQRTLGMTISTVKDSFVGIIIAFLFIWFANGIWPGGVTEGGPTHIWTCGFVYTVLTTASIVWLNLSMVTRLYCLPYHLAYMMHFLKPKPAEADWMFSHHFDIDSRGLAFGYLVVTFLGGIMSVLASCLPTPIMAHRTAMAKLTSASQAFCIIYKTLVHNYLYGAEQSGIQRNKVFVQRTAELLTEMQADVDASWWEHMDAGKYGKIRFFLGSHVRMARELLDRIRATQERLLELPVTDARTKLLEEMKAPMEALVKTILQLFEICTAATMDGVIDCSEKDNFHRTVKQAETQIKAVSDKFAAACKSIAGDSFGARHAAFAKDYCAVYLIVGLACLVVDFSRVLSGYDDSEKDRLWTRILQATKGWCIGVFSGLGESAHLNFALRNSISLMLSFTCGYFGFLDLVPKYTSDIACQTSMLISTFIGSGMQKNLRRFQGVTLGSFAGFALNRIYCFFGGSGLILCASQFVFTSTMYHIFLTNSDVGYSCYLAAVWASISMNRVCASTEGDIDPTNGPVSQAGSLRVLGILLATFFIGMTDLLLANDSASSEAIRSFAGFLTKCQGIIRSWFIDTSVAERGVRSKFSFLQREGPSELQFVRARSAEAVMEPSYWHRRPWNQRQFLNFEKAGHEVRLNILTMQWAIVGVPASNGVALELEIVERDQSVTAMLKPAKKHMDTMLHLFEGTQKFCDIKKRLIEGLKDLVHEISIAMKTSQNTEELVEKTCKDSYLRHYKSRADVEGDFEQLSAEISKAVSAFDFEKNLGEYGEMRLHIAIMMLEVLQNFICHMQYQTYVDC